jgi:hypothetical protein
LPASFAGLEKNKVWLWRAVIEGVTFSDGVEVTTTGAQDAA